MCRACVIPRRFLLPLSPERETHLCSAGREFESQRSSAVCESLLNTEKHPVSTARKLSGVSPVANLTPAGSRLPAAAASTL